MKIENKGYKKMADRRTATVDQLNEIKLKLESVSNQVTEIDVKLETQINLSEIEHKEIKHDFNELRVKLQEAKSKIDSFDLLPLRISTVEENFAQFKAIQETQTPKVDDMYEIISSWRGFSKVIGWISENVKKITVVGSTVTIFVGGGYYGYDTLTHKFAIVPVVESAQTTPASPHVYAPQAK